MKPFEIVAHRGITDTYPENTIPAFEQAIELGAVHLHPTQLTPKVVEQVRNSGIEIHAWDVNDEQSLKICTELGIPRICTDNFQQAKSFRQTLLAVN